MFLRKNTGLGNEPSGNIPCQGVADNIDALSAEIVGEEISDIHDRGIVFTGEPKVTLSPVIHIDFARITTSSIRDGAVINILSIHRG